LQDRKVSGAWVFRGTRLPVATIFENLEDGLTIEEIMEQFDVTRDRSLRYWTLQHGVSLLQSTTSRFSVIRVPSRSKASM
jgi:transposase-like protein